MLNSTEADGVLLLGAAVMVYTELVMDSGEDTAEVKLGQEAVRVKVPEVKILKPLSVATPTVVFPVAVPDRLPLGLATREMV